MSSTLQRLVRTVALVALAAACDLRPDSTVVGSGDAGEDTKGITVAPDRDLDGISDNLEGCAESPPPDSDGDGTPDCEDDDSDGDGVRDEDEAGTNVPGDRPRDTDGDGTPDYLDDDSDGNGIPDSVEGSGDRDADGIVDSSDTDNDGDLVPDHDEVGPDPSSPLDSDGDGFADLNDPDSDNDTVGDRHELTADSDHDGLPDRIDLDSDGDGQLDADEAGDEELATPPIDTDGDGDYDYRDPDSDNDGLGDGDEVAAGTSPRHADTDADGVTDLIEVAACAGRDPSCAGDATDDSSSPRTHGDFVFLEPYEELPSPTRDTLVFSTDIQMADVYILMDTTGSMSTAISSLKSGLSTPETGLIDRVRAAIPDVWFGVGDFRDYVAGGYGSYSDYAYHHRQDLSVDAAASQAAVNGLAAGGGADWAESDIPALYAIATGHTLPGNATTAGPLPARTDCTDGRWGYPCFRPEAVPVVVLITDAPFHNGPTAGYNYSDATLGGHAPTYAEAVAALVEARVRIVGIATTSTAKTEIDALGVATGSVDVGGSPLTTLWSWGSGISDAVVDQIETLSSQVPMDISVVYVDDPTDGVDTALAFLDHLEANTTGDPALGCGAHAAIDTNADGHLDTFPDVLPGDPVCFDVIPRQNDTVPPTAEPQLFKATIRVVGDGLTPLDERDVYFLVPPVIELPGGPI